MLKNAVSVLKVKGDVHAEINLKIHKWKWKWIAAIVNSVSRFSKPITKCFKFGFLSESKGLYV